MILSLIISLLAIECIVAGLVLSFVTYRHRTEFGRTVPWYDQRYWFIRGGLEKFLTAKGRRIHTLSTVFMGVGMGLGLIAVWGRLLLQL